MRWKASTQRPDRQRQLQGVGTRTLYCGQTSTAGVNRGRDLGMRAHVEVDTCTDSQARELEEKWFVNGFVKMEKERVLCN